MSESKETVHEALSRVISNKLLDKTSGKKLDLGMCLEIYREIFSFITEILQESKVPVSNEGANLISQMYYDSIKINGRHELDPDIFTQRAKLDKISTKELALLTQMFRGTPFCEIFTFEIKKRS